jgi:hypothetical protein
VDESVRRYVDSIPAGQRELFDRVHGLILAACPDAAVSLSYRIPCYRAGRRRLYLGVWQHGVSLYGWRQDQDGGFTARHPELLSGRATIRIRKQDAAVIGDGELTELIRAALAA